MTVRYAVQVRKRVEVCTDPQRRCYNGVFASSEVRWTEWDTLLSYPDPADAVSSVATFAFANKDREYRVQPEEVKDGTAE